MDIENELKKFEVTDAAIAELSQKYMPLAINGVEDKKGYKEVNAARKIVKGYRVDVDKRRKELNADALEFQRRINGEAKRIIALLETIETHLESEEKRIDQEIERIKREKEEAEIMLVRERTEKLSLILFKFDGVWFTRSGLKFFQMQLQISLEQVKSMSEKDFEDYFHASNKVHQKEMQIIEEEKKQQEAERLAEAQRLEEQRIAQELERKRLEEIAIQIVEKEAALKAEQQRIEDQIKLAEKLHLEKIEAENKKINESLNDKSFICTKEDVNSVNLIVPEKNILQEMYIDPHNVTTREEYSSKAGFDYAIKVVMQCIQDLIEDPERHTILDTLKENIEQKVYTLRHF